MRVTALSLRDFRSYEAADVELAAGPCVFVGPNGQGKTNLVEALGYLATLGSHRVATDAPLVRHGAPRAVVGAMIDRGDRELLVEIEITPGRANRARVNRSPVARPRDIVGALRLVVFAPEDLDLVKGDPAGRRAFLDGVLSTRTPRLAGVKADYDRVLKQRNALLKSAFTARRPHATGDSDVQRTLTVWNGQLAVLGATVIRARHELIVALFGPARQAYATLTLDRTEGPDQLTMSYLSAVEGLSFRPDEPILLSESEIAERLEAQMVLQAKAEIDRGVSLVGPHRDDLVLGLGELPARGYASHGESWSIALALRLASYDVLRADDVQGGSPVLVLDDVFAELDTKRRAMLAAHLEGAEQVLVTAAVPDDVPEGLRATRYDVVRGGVSRA